MSILRWHRLFIQLVFFVFTPAVWAAAFSGLKDVAESLGAAQVIEGSATLVLLVALLAFTMVFGRFFCGYACAFGTLNDIVYQIGDGILRLFGVSRRKMMPLLEIMLRYFKYVLLAGICAVAYLGAVDIVNENSPWTAFSCLVHLRLDGFTAAGLVLLVLIVCGMAYKERFFCEFLCPMGAVFAMTPIAPWAGRWRDSSCCPKGCGLCGANCPVGIGPDNDAVIGGECISCGRCQFVCPNGAVRSGFRALSDADGPDGGGAGGSDGSAGADGERERRDTRSFRVYLAETTLEALFLLGLFWVLGVVRFLPALPFVQLGS